jgi:hypothetical protein
LQRPTNQDTVSADCCRRTHGRAEGLQVVSHEKGVGLLSRGQLERGGRLYDAIQTGGGGMDGKTVDRPEIGPGLGSILSNLIQHSKDLSSDNLTTPTADGLLECPTASDCE